MTRINIAASLKSHADRYSWEALDNALARLSEGKPLIWRSVKDSKYFSRSDLRSDDLRGYFSLLRQFHNEEKGVGILCVDLDRMVRWVSLHGVFVAARSQNRILDKCLQYCREILFDYNQFSKGKGFAVSAAGKLYWRQMGDWGAANFIRKSGFTACAYCNAGLVETEGPLHSSLDHYYPRERFPFLALSLSNLIPVCERCNTMKGDNAYENWTHANPVGDDLHELLRFDGWVRNPRVFSGIPHQDDLEIELNDRRPTGRSIQALRLVNDLKIGDRYNRQHWRQAADFLALVHELESARVDVLRKYSSGMLQPVLLRRYLGMTPDKDLIKSTPFLKLKIDLLQGVVGQLPRDSILARVNN